MKSWPPGLANDIKQGATTLAALYTITRTDGTIIRCTDCSSDLVVGGETFTAATGYGRTALQNNLSLQPGSVEVSGPLLTSEAIIADDIRAGRYDGARVLWQMVNHQNLAHGVGTVRNFIVGTITPTDHMFKVELLGLLNLLSHYITRLITPDCDADFADLHDENRCKLDPALFTETGTVTTVNDPQLDFVASITGSRAANFFFLGLVTWTTGLNAGLSFEVKAQSASNDLTFFLPTYFPIQVGDTFSILGGCDKTISGPNGCQSHDNVVNFRGFPYVPGLDAVVVASVGDAPQL